MEKILVLIYKKYLLFSQLDLRFYELRSLSKISSAE